MKENDLSMSINCSDYLDGQIRKSIKWLNINKF